METYSLKFAEALARIEPVEVLALPGRKDGRPPAISSLLTFGLRACWHLLRSPSGPSVVHVGDMAMWPLAFVARLRSRRTVIVISAHGTDVAYHRRGGLRGTAYGYYLRVGGHVARGARVVANSEATRDVVVESGWQQVYVIPLATDLTGPQPTGESEPHILFAGRLVERKGCGWFIRHVLPQLPPHIRLKVAGTGWEEKEKQALSDPRVDFLGALQGEALVDAYRRASCVIVPNIEPNSGEYEGFGLVATEAAAAGGVVIAARTGGLVQAVAEDVTGLLVAPGDARQWTDAIRATQAWTTEERRKFLRRSMAFCQDYYSWDRVARETKSIYEGEGSALPGR